jgi:DNA-binding GntR family transcriptional regulator
MSRTGERDLADTLRALIIRGGVAPGQRLTEEWLGSEFGVSRIPVREALRVLATEGFVRSEGYGGTFVSTLSAEAAHDLLDVRAVLEPLAAAQAAVRRTPEQLETFRRLLAEGGQARRQRRYEDLRTLKGQFYEHLARASQNDTIIALMQVVRFKIEWATSIEAVKRAERRTWFHREIVDAIAERDPGRAASAVAAHIDAAYAAHGWRRAVDVSYEAVSPLP